MEEIESLKKFQKVLEKAVSEKKIILTIEPIENISSDLKKLKEENLSLETLFDIVLDDLEGFRVLYTSLNGKTEMVNSVSYKELSESLKRLIELLNKKYSK
ncbi:MAG: hypothetical protein AB7D96_10875 [Arcobacteraceae bacterium]